MIARLPVGLWAPHLRRSFSAPVEILAKEGANAAVKAVSGAALSPKRASGRTRWGLVGFLLGVTLSGAYGYNRLYNEHVAQDSSIAKELKHIESVAIEVRDYCKTIDNLKQEVSKLKTSLATHAHVDEFRRLLGEVHSVTSKDILSLKARLHDMENEISYLAETSQNQPAKK